MQIDFVGGAWHTHNIGILSPYTVYKGNVFTNSYLLTHPADVTPFTLHIVIGSIVYINYIKLSFFHAVY